MATIPNIKFEDITIPEKLAKYAEGYDYERCKNGLWGIYNLIKKIIQDPDPEQARLINNLYVIGVHAAFKDDGMDSLVYIGRTHKKLRWDVSNGKFLFRLEEYGFVFSELVTAKNAPRNKLTTKDISSFVLSYGENDFKDVILGIKLFADISVDQPYFCFTNGDMRIFLEGAQIPYSPPVDIKDVLSEERFNIISDGDKAFVIAFDKAMNGFGYDCNKTIGIYDHWNKEFTYSKTGVASKTVFARIHIDDEGEIYLRLYFNDINKHRAYIENAPAHIKDAFAFDGGDCQKTSPELCVQGCKSMKIYTIDGQRYNKCCHSPGHFAKPSVKRLPDYLSLLAEFNPPKKSKIVK